MGWIGVAPRLDAGWQNTSDSGVTVEEATGQVRSGRVTSRYDLAHQQPDSPVTEYLTYENPGMFIHGSKVACVWRDHARLFRTSQSLACFKTHGARR